MTTLKSKIATWLSGKSFENSKDALWQFEKETGNKSSIIYFSRVFAAHKADVKETKCDKVSAFIRNGNHKTCEIAHTAYIASGQEVSLIYFSRVYTAVRKEKGATPKTIATTKAPQPIQVITLTGLSAKKIIVVVKEKTGEDVKMDLKNKARIVKTATSLLTSKGFQIN